MGRKGGEIRLKITKIIGILLVIGLLIGSIGVAAAEDDGNGPFGAQDGTGPIGDQIPDQDGTCDPEGTGPHGTA